MYRIMLADDEGIVIDSLKFIIEKEFGDLCEVRFAKTGRSVIELAETYRPDIAIMDIQMPGINGIEAMKEIRQTNSQVIFIVMSAFDKFDYAQESIRLGVQEYISKPMERTKIVEALKKAMRNIDTEREKRKRDLIIREKLETVVPIIETGFISNILFQEHFEEDMQSYKTMLEMDADYGYMMTIVCGENQEGFHMTNAVGSSVRMQKYYREIRDRLKRNFQCLIGSILSNKIAVLVPYHQEYMDYNERIELIETARELVRTLRKETDISFRIGFGGVKELSELKDSYNEAIHALLTSNGSVAHADDLPIRCEYDEDYPVHLEKKLFAKIEAGELSEAIATGEAFFDWLIQASPNDTMSIRVKILEFVLRAEYLAYEAGGMVYRIDSRQDYLPRLMELDSMDGLKGWFTEKLTQACRNVMYKKNERSNHLIETAREYIRTNYNKDISLDDISRNLNLSPYYFSKIFKEATKEGFVEYLTGIRMEKAKELLNQPEYSMKEIGVLVGYADPNYFSRTFKKNVGVTPTEYREGKTGL